MANKIALYSISELFERNFFIPSYQRGYRWDKQQVEELLNDIYDFAVKPNKAPKEFYCLQPVVVKSCNGDIILKNILQSDFDNNVWYEVIDGQQRLTTIRILISYLVNELYPGKTLYEKHRKNPFIIEYETRKGCSSFIDHNTESDETIDFYFITEARKTIQKWFDTAANVKDPQKAKEKIRNTLIYNKEEQDQEGIVQVIWYEIEDNAENSNNAIETFIRINLGKIPLTSSELVKALFLQEREFYKGKVKENEIAKLKQLQIATEWDRIENSLQNEDLWWFINEKENNIPARIDFIFNLIKDVEISKDSEIELRKKLSANDIEARKRTCPTIIEKIGTDDYSTFRYFYHEFKQLDFDKLNKEWGIIQNYYNTIEEWYNNPIWYHYIGFLIYCGIPIIEIYNITRYDFETKELITTKSGITDSLKKKIKDYFKTIEWTCDSNNISYLDISYSKTNKKTIRELLLLYNIECIVKQCELKTLIYKFPFKSFKEIKDINGMKMSWDVEHIDSSTPNPLPNRSTRMEWLKFALEEIEEKTENAVLIEKIKEYINNEKSLQDFNELHRAVIDLLKENENDETLKNNIGNLTLLDAGTNRGYGNALFPTKRKVIIKKDKLGIFIPICTKNVFLKYFNISGERNGKWSVDDIVSYRNDIADTLKGFLPKQQLKPIENE